MESESRNARLLVLFLLASSHPLIHDLAWAGDESLDTPPQPAIHHTIIELATKTTPRSDTASVAELAAGRLLVVYHKYEAKSRSGHDDGLCRIWSKTSHDGGRSWVDPRMLVDVAPGDVSVMMPALVKLRNGDLLLICQRIHSPYGTRSTMLLFCSTDDGASFVEQSPIWRQRADFPIQGGASSLVELKSGRLLLPYHANGREGVGLTAWCQLSDDQGKTWRQSKGNIELFKRGAMEASVAEFEDGTLAMSLRTQLGGPYFSRSTDGGETWSPAEATGLEGGESCTCLRRIPGTNDLLLLWNNSKYIPRGHHHYGERTPLRAAVSRDHGKTWRVVGTIADDPKAEYANLDCLFTSRGTAVITYMMARPAWNRSNIDLRAAIIDKTWFCSQ
ncbi:MAG: exo-alpha-sialidase [Planctomycetes bacterium]|nr:exo-alpha-sialidase [Planctomycetota bacterium]